MALRTGHGTGRGVPRIEVLPPDELPPATPAAPVLRDRGPDGRFVKGNAAGRAQRAKGPGRTLTGIQADEAFRPFAAWGKRYAAYRRGELARLHGGEISAGVGALVESASLALAASRYLAARAAQSGDPDLFKRSSTLANDARQNELAAWELAAREAKSRAREVTTPFWLEAPETPPDAPELEGGPVGEFDDEGASTGQPEPSDGA